MLRAGSCSSGIKQTRLRLVCFIFIPEEHSPALGKLDYYALYNSRFLSISIVYDLLLKKIFVSVNVLIINYYVISLLTILVIIIKQYDYYFIGERISFQTKSYFLIGKYVNSLGCSWSDEWDNVETFYWLWGEYLLFSEICTFAPRLDIYI